jgi:hypothetical protein
MRKTGYWQLGLVVAILFQPGWAQSVRELHRTLAVSPTDSVILEVELAEADLQIAYSHDGQVAIGVTVQSPAASAMDEESPGKALIVDQDGNHIHLRDGSHGRGDIRTTYRIDVPYRTEVHTFVDHGKQSIVGIMGPVQAGAGRGDIKASYISKEVKAQAVSGNLEFQVIGDRVEAQTGRGNIACIRVAQGVSTKTGNGDIALMVVGPSQATIKSGSGRIEAEGVRGRLEASTDAGDLRVKAVPHDDWQLSSSSGNVQIELPPASGFEVDATTRSGEVVIEHDDMERPAPGVQHFRQKARGGGKLIEIHTGSGKILIA